MEFWISQLFNGISYGALLFLLAGGLSLIFGMMRIVNMTHGSYYLLGGYVGLTVIWRTGSFALAIVLGALAISLVGIAEWNAFLKRLSGQELGQVLTTMGFALIFQDLALVLWGGDPSHAPGAGHALWLVRRRPDVLPGVSRLHRRGRRSPSRWSSG